MGLLDVIGDEGGTQVHSSVSHEVLKELDVGAGSTA